MTTARTVAEVIAAEAVSGTPAQRLADMRAIASVIANRAQQLGVSMEDVVAHQGEFNAYGQRMPPGTTNLIDMAQQALDYVAENGPTTSATYYATPRAVPNLPGDLSYETETAGHQFFSDPHGRAIRTAAGTLTPNRYAFAQNLTDVPTPFSPDDAGIPGNLLAGSSQEQMPGHWGLNPDVAPVPYETFNQWEAMANAPPVQAPAQGLLSAPKQGLLSPPADLQNFADGMMAQRQTIPQQSMPALNNFADLANAGPMGGYFAAPQDRFAGAEPGQSQPFDRYVNSTSFPATVDYGAYPPGSVPMVDTSAVAPNRVQTTSISPGLLGEPADLDNFAEAMSAQRQVAPAPMTDGFSEMAAAGPMGGDYASPASRMGIAEPGMDQSRFDGSTVSVANNFDQGRFATPPTTAFDASRFGPPSIDVATNTQSFMDQPTISAAPANLGSFPEGYGAQRGPTTGLLSADFQSLQGNTERQLQDLTSLAPMVPGSSLLASAGTISPVSSLLSPSSVSTVNRQLSVSLPVGLLGDQPLQQSSLVASGAMPSFQSTIAAPGQIPGVATPEQQAAGYQQMAASAPNITNLSGATGIWDDGTSYQNAVASTPAVPSLDTVDVPDQPTVADVEVPGPATINALDQQRQAATRPAVRTNPMVQTNPSLLGSVKNAINPGTVVGGLLGSLAGPVGTVAGGLLGNSVYQNGGFRGLLSQPSYDINPIGSGVQASYSVWGGGLAPGSQATATNGSQITAMPGGVTAVTNKYGATTVFDSNGKAYGYHGTALGEDQDQDTESEGGLFSGW